MKKNKLRTFYDKTVKGLELSVPSEKEFDRMYISRMKWRVFEDWKFLREYVEPSASIIDVGAVPPILASLLAAEGYSQVAIADPNVETYKKYLDDVGILSEKYDFIADVNLTGGAHTKYDLIILAEVIEHLSGNMIPPFESLRQRLNSDGLLYVTTPNLRSISGLCAILFYGSGLATKWNEGVRKQFERAGGDCGYFGHVREYGDCELIRFVESFSFKHVESRYISRPIKYSLGTTMKLASIVENFTPNMRLFGKHLFRAI